MEIKETFLMFFCFFCGIVKLICELWHTFLINLRLQQKLNLQPSTLFRKNLLSAAEKFAQFTHNLPYLEIIVDAQLSFKEYMAQLRQNLNRTNCLLAKLRHQVSRSLLKIIYFALFNSHLRYAAQVWGQGSSNVVDMVKRTQNKVSE